MDLDLIREIAVKRPDWQLIVVGPVVKIDPATLPHAANIHYLGSKPYKMLPDYLAGWDVALMPFARNDATRFISPTKTPEYLAAGCPVISTPIYDVVQTYGKRGLVAIAETADEFIAAAEKVLRKNDYTGWLKRVDAFLATQSWDYIWSRMQDHMQDALTRKLRPERLLPARDLRRPAIDPVRLVYSRKQEEAEFDYLVVGAGFAGSVLAERLASQSNKRVLIIDKRPHVAGNAYDCKNSDGIMIHKYGPHIFHTNAVDVFHYLSKFTKWRAYEHRVLASVDNKLLPIPINLDTVNRLYGLNLTSSELEDFFATLAEPKDKIVTSEDVVVSRVGRDLYEKFFRGYTCKQWGVDPSELDKSVTARVPTRTNHDDRYFGDTFQYMPTEGYTKLFENMLDHPNITVMLNTDFEKIKKSVSYKRLIYTGPVDQYFNHCFGVLPYRSLRFEHVTRDMEWHQPVAVVNYPQDQDYTRITEYKHLTGQKHARTSLSYEYPTDIGEPYYPVPRPENAALYKRYEALADAQKDVIFAGRLATYRYYNMDQVVAQALSIFKRIADTSFPVIQRIVTTVAANEHRAL